MLVNAQFLVEVRGGETILVGPVSNLSVTTLRVYVHTVRIDT